MMKLTRELVRDAHLASHDELNWSAWPLQTGLGGCPWRVALCAMLLRRTKRTAAEPVLRRILEQWPTPELLAQANSRDLEALLQPLGLQRTRARQMITFSDAFAFSVAWKELYELNGVGPYVADSVGLACFGCTDLDCNDEVLMEYARKLREASSPPLRDHGGEG